jgi:hypothetical protein
MQGLASRVVSTTKVLVSGASRVLLAGCGVLDVVQFDLLAQQSPAVVAAHYQQEDRYALARLILCLGTGTDVSPTREAITQARAAVRPCVVQRDD